MTRRHATAKMTTRLAALILAAMWLGACGTGPTYIMPAEGELAWPYWPVSMRIHPLTRFVQDRQTGVHWLEARIEFRDRDQDIAKSYGTLTLTLFEVLAAGESGEVLRRWHVDLTNLDDNRAQFDVVTRTYLCRLEVAYEALPPRMELIASFASPDGQVFDAPSFMMNK
jgi:hypothetical protein